MGYKINYEKNIEMQMKADTIMQECLLALDTAEEILKMIKETEAVKCKAKNSLNAYIDDVIISRMTAVTREAIQWYMLEQSCYVYEMYEHDDNDQSIIEEEHLEGIISGLTEHYGVTEENLAGCRAVAEGVSDIIDLYAKAPDDMENAYAGLKEQTEKTRDAFGEYQQKFEGRSENLTEYIRKCYNMVSQCAYSDISMTEYDVAYTDIPGVETLEYARNEMTTDIGYTIEEMERVEEKKKEIVTAYVRRKEGEAKIRKLGGIIIGGLSLLCPLALSFTMPQMILSCSISGISVLYNTDQYLQGKQLLDAAETRNTDAEIEKIVDFHNETLNRGYEIMGNITTAYSGILCMGTLIYGLGGGNVTFLSATKETGEDLLTDYVAGNIDEAMGGGSSLRSMLISNVLSNALSGAKGALDVIDAADVRKAADIDVPDVKTAVKDIDVPDVKTMVKDIDAPDVKTAVKDIEVSDVKTAVKNIDAPDVKTATNIKEPVVGTQQGNIRSEIKADIQTDLDVKSQSVVSGKEIESGSRNSTEVLENANYAQKTYSNTFSTEGRRIYSNLAGEPINTIDDLVNAINSGKVNVVDLPVEYIVRDGNTLILNTRTSQALTQAGIPRSQWNAIDRTGDALFEELLSGQLSRNKLTSEGISMVRPSGGQ